MIYIHNKESICGSFGHFVMLRGREIRRARLGVQSEIF